eukprot:IDg13448t1
MSEVNFNLSLATILDQVIGVENAEILKVCKIILLRATPIACILLAVAFSVNPKLRIALRNSILSLMPVRVCSLRILRMEDCVYRMRSRGECVSRGFSCSDGCTPVIFDVNWA